MDKLFDIPVSLSPRLAWMKKHGITVRETEIQVPKIVKLAELGSKHATADDEETACAILAKGLHIPLWNEA